MISVPGAWVNFDHIEESLTMIELKAIVEASRERRQEDLRFQASLQGIDLGRPVDERRKAVEDRAKARLAGLDPDEYSDMSLAELGIEVTQEA